MNTFTASNGVKIRPEEGYGAMVSNLTLINEEMDALREFFQAEEDKRLGRWRHPNYPDIYVRPMNGHPNMAGVVKDDEAGLAYGQFSRDVRASLDPMAIVAHAYFEAHPEPKPWHDAKPGEVWSIIGPNLGREAPTTAYGGAIALCFEDLTEPEPQLWFVYPDGGASDNIEVTDKAITAGYRIHPPQEQKA